MSKTVVVTGASTGIGKACALRLNALGYQVFAGVRNEADGASLKAEAPERLTPVLIDVTNRAQIGEAARIVAESVGPDRHERQPRRADPGSAVRRLGVL